MDGGEQSPPSFFGDILHFRIQLAEMENVPRAALTGGRRREYAGRRGSRLEQGGDPRSNIQGEARLMKSHLGFLAVATVVATMSSGAAQAAASIAVPAPGLYTYSQEGLALSGTAAVTLPDVVVTFGNNLTYQDDILITLAGTVVAGAGRHADAGHVLRGRCQRGRLRFAGHRAAGSSVSRTCPESRWAHHARSAGSR